MATRIGLLATLALVPAALAGCAAEAPTAPATLRLAVVADAHGGAPLATHMLQEVTTQPAWAGDPDGSGEALITVNPGLGEVCWEITAADIRLPATSAHIHEADAGIRGGIVAGLTAPDMSGLATGCRSGLDPELLRRIIQDPARFYVNVHTTDYPAGAIRGQLAR